MEKGTRLIFFAALLALVSANFRKLQSQHVYRFQNSQASSHVDPCCLFFQANDNQWHNNHNNACTCQVKWLAEERGRKSVKGSLTTTQLNLIKKNIVLIIIVTHSIVIIRAWMYKQWSFHWKCTYSHLLPFFLMWHIWILLLFVSIVIILLFKASIPLKLSVFRCC